MQNVCCGFGCKCTVVCNCPVTCICSRCKGSASSSASNVLSPIVGPARAIIPSGNPGTGSRPESKSVFYQSPQKALDSTSKTHQAEQSFWPSFETSQYVHESQTSYNVPMKSYELPKVDSNLFISPEKILAAGMPLDLRAARPLQKELSHVSAPVNMSLNVLPSDTHYSPPIKTSRKSTDGDECQYVGASLKGDPNLDTSHDVRSRKKAQRREIQTDSLEETLQSKYSPEKKYYSAPTIPHKGYLPQTDSPIHKDFSTEMCTQNLIPNVNVTAQSLPPLSNESSIFSLQDSSERTCSREERHMMETYYPSNHPIKPNSTSNPFRKTYSMSDISAKPSSSMNICRAASTSSLVAATSAQRPRIMYSAVSPSTSYIPSPSQISESRFSASSFNLQGLVPSQSPQRRPSYDPHQKYSSSVPQGQKLPTFKPQDSSDQHMFQGSSGPHKTEYSSSPYMAQSSMGPHMAQSSTDPHMVQRSSGSYTAQYPSGSHMTQYPSGPHMTQYPGGSHMTQYPGGPHAAEHSSGLYMAQSLSGPQMAPRSSDPKMSHGSSGPYTSQYLSRPYMRQGSSGPHMTQSFSDPHMSQYSSGQRMALFSDYGCMRVSRGAHVADSRGQYTAQGTRDSHMSRNPSSLHITQGLQGPHISEPASGSRDCEFGRSSRVSVIQHSSDPHMLQDSTGMHMAQYSSGSNMAQGSSISHKDQDSSGSNMAQGSSIPHKDQDSGDPQKAQSSEGTDTPHIAQDSTARHITQHSSRLHMAQSSSDPHISEYASSSHGVHDSSGLYMSWYSSSSHTAQDSSSRISHLASSDQQISQISIGSYITQGSSEQHMSRYSHTPHTAEASSELHMSKGTAGPHIAQYSSGTDVCQDSGVQHMTRASSDLYMPQESRSTSVLEDSNPCTEKNPGSSEIILSAEPFPTDGSSPIFQDSDSDIKTPSVCGNLSSEPMKDICDEYMSETGSNEVFQSKEDKSTMKEKISISPLSVTRKIFSPLAFLDNPKIYQTSFPPSMSQQHEYSASQEFCPSSIHEEPNSLSDIQAPGPSSAADAPGPSSIADAPGPSSIADAPGPFSTGDSAASSASESGGSSVSRSPKPPDFTRWSDLGNIPGLEDSLLSSGTKSFDKLRKSPEHDTEPQ